MAATVFSLVPPQKSAPGEGAEVVSLAVVMKDENADVLMIFEKSSSH